MSDEGAPDEPKARPQVVASGEQDIGRRVMRGTFWVALSRWGTLLITWPTTIMLARILDPSDYGYLALVNVFTRFGRIVAEAGVSGTIILGPSLSEDQYSRLHGWSMAMFLAVGAVIAGLAVPIEHLYDSPGVRWILLALVTSFIADGLTLVPVARMRKAVRFREIASADAARTLVEAGASLTFALRGFGYWSLIIGFLSGIATYAALITRAAGMWPSRPTFTGLGPTLRNARRLLVASVTTFTATSSDGWVGGAVTGTAALGGYAYMAGLARAPIEKLAGIITYASGSLLGNFEGDPERVGRTIVRMTRLTSLLMFPIFAGVALVADDLVLGLLGEKWEPYTMALRILCLNAALLPMSAALDQAAVALGHSRTVAMNGVVLLLLLPFSFFSLGGLFGATGLALAWLVPVPLILGRLVLLVRRETGTPIRAWLAALRLPTLGIAVMSAGVLLLQSSSTVAPLAPLVRLSACAAVGATLFIGFMLLFASEDIAWLRQRLARR